MLGVSDEAPNRDVVMGAAQVGECVAVVWVRAGDVGLGRHRGHERRTRDKYGAKYCAVEFMHWFS
jgi:hypothetical protein